MENLKKQIAKEISIRLDEIVKEHDQLTYDYPMEDDMIEDFYYSSVIIKFTLHYAYNDDYNEERVAARITDVEVEEVNADILIGLLSEWNEDEVADLEDYLNEFVEQLNF